MRGLAKTAGPWQKVKKFTRDFSGKSVEEAHQFKLEALHRRDDKALKDAMKKEHRAIDDQYQSRRKGVVGAAGGLAVAGTTGGAVAHKKHEREKTASAYVFSTGAKSAP